jgi:D-alanyl-D-alanine carboxypeptidase
MTDPPPPVRPSVGPPFDARLEELLDAMAARAEVHSATMAVRSGDGSLDWRGSRGEVSPGGPPMTPDTPFFAASITKLYIASTVMRLVEEGNLTLESRLVGLLPTAVTRGLHVQRAVDRTGEITVEHLLAHASGLPDFIEDYPVRGAEDRRSLVEILVEDGDRGWTLDDTVRRVRSELRPHFSPQDLRGRRVRIRYSDTNYQLLIAIAEARVGAPFDRVLHALVLEPLGLRDTWIPDPESTDRSRGRPVATLMVGDEVARFPRFLSSIHDLNATTGDLLRFLQGMVQGELFRNAGTWPRMQARFNRFALPTDRAALRQPSWPIEYGLGVMRFRLPRPLAPFRPVPGVVGHTGSTGTWLFHAPDLDLYLAGGVSQLTAGALPFRFVPRVLRAAQEVLGE